MTDEERERRRAAIAEEITDRQFALGHDSPFPAFLNIVIDHIVEIESALNTIIPGRFPVKETRPMQLLHADPTAGKDTDGGR